jgi:hypothetical protein
VQTCGPASRRVQELKLADQMQFKSNATIDMSTNGRRACAPDLKDSWPRLVVAGLERILYSLVL